MRGPLVAAMLLLGVCTGVHAQERPFMKSFSLELGTGFAPLHTLLISPSSDSKNALADKGQEVDNSLLYHPSVTLSAVWRTRPKTEMVVTANVSWAQCGVIQYGTFGTDPSGKPRYDLQHGGHARSVALDPNFSLTWVYRHLWNPEDSFVAYSGIGVGFTPAMLPLPLMNVVPVGFRIGQRHFYGFGELTMGPVASIVQGGIGWRF